MSEQQKDETSPKQADPARLDPTTAAAALALAVTSAEKASGKQPKSRADEPVSGMRTVRARALSRGGAPKHAAHAAAIAIAIGLVAAGGTTALPGGRQAIELLPAWTEGASSNIQNHENMVRLSEDVRALRGVIEGFKASFDQQREATGHTRPLMERLEDLERANQDATAKIVRVAEISERIERAGSAAEAKLADIAVRLGKMERQADKPEQDASDPGQTGSVPEAKAIARRATLDGWVLREVYDGAAVVEGRNGRLHEVVPGRTLPGVGRVNAIERRGRSWVVVTAKGIIGPPERWQ
jgi:hypothetical protein